MSILKLREKNTIYLKRVLSMPIVILFIFCMITNTFAAYGDEWQDYYETSNVKYKDVSKSHWAYEYINRVSKKNWFGGYPDGTFRPDGKITRAEAAKVFSVFLSLDVDPVSKTSFYDVDRNEWYAPYIEASKDLFPVHTSIQGKTPFQPEMPITREDTVYALVKSLGYGEDIKVVDESVLNMFDDAYSISKNCRPYFVIALENNLVSGFPDGTIRAQDPLTRAEFATLLDRGTNVGFNDSYKPYIKSVELSPYPTIKMSVGESIKVTAKALYTDGTKQDYNKFSMYEDSTSCLLDISGNSISAKQSGNTIIKFNDEYLDDKELRVVVEKPTYAPTIKVVGYDDVMYESSVTFTGIVTDESHKNIDFTCNGKDVILEKDGSFTVKVNLKTGKNDIVFKAVNIYGNENTKTVTIEYGEEKKSEQNADDVEFENGLKIIKGVVVKGDPSYDYIQIPSYYDGFCIEEIGEGAFKDCRKLEDIDIPDTVKKIGKNAFENCVSLSYVAIPEKVKVIQEKTFMYCNDLEYISLSSYIETIGEYAFFGCNKLRSVEMYEGLERIEKCAFKDSSIGIYESIKLPQSLVYIADDAFDKNSDVEIYSNRGTYAYGWLYDRFYPSIEGFNNVPEVPIPYRYDYDAPAHVTEKIVELEGFDL